MADDRVQIHGERIGEGEYTGQSYTAVPIVIDAATHEEADQRAQDFVLAVVLLTEQHPGVEIPSDVRQSLSCLEQAAGLTRRFIARQARRQ